MTSKRVCAETQRSRLFCGFIELSYAHRVILENAKNKCPGYFYECLTANILGAFKMEAYFNHIGPRLFADWWKKDKRTSKYRKLDRILSQIGTDINQKDQRIITLNTLFKIRDEVAHSKTIELTQKLRIEEGDIEELRRRKPLLEWEECSTIEFATRAFEHTESLIVDIHKAAKFDLNELRRPAHSYSIKILSPGEQSL